MEMILVDGSVITARTARHRGFGKTKEAEVAMPGGHGWGTDLRLEYNHWPERYCGWILRFLNVFVSDILPLFLQKARAIRTVGASEERGRKSHTPLFQLSQNLSSPWSKPTVKAKVVAKMLVTKIPAKESVSFPEIGQSGRQRRTVSSGDGVVKSVGELETKGKVSKDPDSGRR